MEWLYKFSHTHILMKRNHTRAQQAYTRSISRMTVDYSLRFSVYDMSYTIDRYIYVHIHLYMSSSDAYTFSSTTTTHEVDEFIHWYAHRVNRRREKSGYGTVPHSRYTSLPLYLSERCVIVVGATEKKRRRQSRISKKKKKCWTIDSLCYGERVMKVKRKSPTLCHFRTAGLTKWNVHHENACERYLCPTPVFPTIGWCIHYGNGFVVSFAVIPKNHHRHHHHRWYATSVSALVRKASNYL